LATKKEEHFCEWRDLALALQIKLAELEVKFAAVLARVGELEHQRALAMKQIVGPKSERMPTPDDEAKKREGTKPRGGYTNPKKRKENAEALALLPTTIEPHPIADSDRRCPHCGDDVTPIGQGDTSFEYEWLPGRLVRKIHVVEVGRCACKRPQVRLEQPRARRRGDPRAAS
jgi:hypothetical protein